jgi:hypothetical protein
MQTGSPPDSGHISIPGRTKVEDAEWSNLNPTPVDLTQESLERLLEEIWKPASSIIVHPTYLVSTFPLPPRRVRRFRLISETEAVQLGIPWESRRRASHPDGWSWVDKRCLARYQRRSYPMLYGFGRPPLKRKKPV